MTNNDSRLSPLDAKHLLRGDDSGFLIRHPSVVTEPPPAADDRDEPPATGRTDTARQIAIGVDWLRENGSMLVAGVAVLLTVFSALWLLKKILVGAGNVIADGVDALSTGWLVHGPITRSINDPVRAWLDAHSAGMPASGHDLWVLWLGTAVALYAAALFGSTYARIGWAVIGVLTAAAAYAGAGDAGQGSAALTVLVWLVLSAPAYKPRGVLAVLSGNVLARWRRRTSRLELDRANDRTRQLLAEERAERTEHRIERLRARRLRWAQAAEAREQEDRV